MKGFKNIEKAFGDWEGKKIKKSAYQRKFNMLKKRIKELEGEKKYNGII